MIRLGLALLAGIAIALLAVILVGEPGSDLRLLELGGILASVADTGE